MRHLHLTQNIISNMALLITISVFVVTCNSCQSHNTNSLQEETDQVRKVTRSFKQDKIQAIAELNKLIQSGNVIASNTLAKIYLMDKDMENPEEAVRILKGALNKGNPQTEILLSICYEEGAGVSKNIEEAVKLIESAASKGDAEGIYQLGDYRLSGKGVKNDKEQAIKLIKQSADMGYSAAAYHYAKILYKGDGVDKDFMTAYNYCSEAKNKRPEDFTAECAMITLEYYQGAQITDSSAYEIGQSYMVLGQYRKAKVAFRRACYGLDESDSRNPQSPGCLAYFKLEMVQQ